MGTSPLLDSPTATLGRFRLIRQLGRGAQGVVYLASDPQLDRQVAIKTLTLSTDSDGERVQNLMREARTASRLSHPNIIPVYEVGSEGATPYIVFEYVEGQTLRQILRADGPLPLARAVVVMSQILAGIAHAHAKGLVHGDITPSNILLAHSGAPRIMDFGISRDVRASAKPVPAGTVGYLAPELFESNGPDFRTDVFALGLVFYEMLTGERAISGADECSTAYRTLNASIPQPSQRQAHIDPRLDEIVRRAVDKNREARFPDGRAMKEALDRFRVPSTTGARTELSAASTHSTVEFLLRRMRHKADFPALSQRIAEISRLTSDANAIPAQKLANLVLQDFALTNKLLKLVNSAAIGGNGRITSVSQAITILGFDQVRAVATGLMLSAPPQGRSMHPGLPEVLVGAFIAGVVGRNLGRMAGLANVEEMFICSMLSRLGEILCIYYFSEDYDEIVRITRAQGENELSASRQILGISFDELGTEIARRWNFSETVLHAMRPLPEGVLPEATTELERIAHCAAFAREICDASWRTPEAYRAQALANLIARFRPTLPRAADHLPALIQHSLDIGRKYCQIIGIDSGGSALIEGLAAWVQPRDLSAASTQQPDAAGARPARSSREPPEPQQPVAEHGEAASTGTGLKGLITRLWTKG